MEEPELKIEHNAAVHLRSCSMSVTSSSVATESLTSERGWEKVHLDFSFRGEEMENSGGRKSESSCARGGFRAIFEMRCDAPLQ